jgi:hypothetical protein
MAGRMAFGFSATVGPSNPTTMVAILMAISSVFAPLHLFSGKVDTEQFPGDTLDIKSDLNPTFVADAHTLEGVPIEDYDLILADQC